MKIFMFKKNKKLIIIIISMFLALCTFLALYLRNKAKAKNVNLSPSSSTMFSKYNVNYGTFMTLFRDSNGDFVFFNSKNKEIYRTKDKIEDFYLLDSNTIAYRSYVYVKDKDTNFTTIKKLSLTDNKLTDVFSTYDKILFNQYNGKIFVYDYSSKQIFYGNDKNTLKILNVNIKFQQMYNSKNRIFFVQYKPVNNDIVSDIYEFNNNMVKELFTVDNKILDISVDYNNSNKVYCLYENYKPDKSVITNSESENVAEQFYSNEKTAKRYEILEKYIVNLSSANNGENIHKDLTGSIISLKNKNILVSRKDNAIYLLNDNLTINSKINDLNKYTIWGFVQTDSNNEYIYYIDSNGNIKKY